MAKEITHEGTKSWWNGTVRTLCGLVIEKPQGVWFVSVNCPSCLAVLRRKRGGRR